MGVWSGSVRIDVAVINGELCGFELKSDRDTLERLPHQAELYSRVFDRVTLVAGGKHAAKAFDLVPDWWGCTIAIMHGTRVKLTDVRTAAINPKPDAYLVAQLLWKEEALALLQKYDIARGCRSKRVKELHQRLAQELPLPMLAEGVRATLKQRNRKSKLAGGQAEMAVDAILNPLSKTSGANEAKSNLVDLKITPAIGEPPAILKVDDGVCVRNKLNAHVNSRGAGRSRSAADKDVLRQGVLDVDGISPSDTRSLGVGGNGRVVPETQLVRKSPLGKGTPKSKFKSGKAMETGSEPAEVIRDGTAGDRNGAPVIAPIKPLEGVTKRASKGRRKRDVASEVHY
jgi:hypothetical protein